MNTFTFKAKRGARRRHVETATFTVDKLWTEQDDGGQAEISHLVDRSYGYQSLRELRWHLAERFSLPVGSVALHCA